MPKFTPKYTTFKTNGNGKSFQPKPGDTKAKTHLRQIKDAVKGDRAPKKKG